MIAALLLACLLGGAFFSSAQAALFFADRAALKAQANGAASSRLSLFLDHPQWLLAAAEVGMLLCLAGFASAGVFYFSPRFGEGGSWLALAALVPTFIFLGLALPRMAVEPRATRFAPRLLAPMSVFLYLFFPVVIVLMGLVKLLVLISGKSGKERVFWYTRDDLKALITSPDQHSLLGEEGLAMIDRVFDFSETTVEEVMIPLIEVEAMAGGATVIEAMQRVDQTMFTRYPVFEERIDNVVGMIRATDLLKAQDPYAAIRPWVRPVRYVPFITPIDELLFTMQRESFNFAVVVDEFGGCVGVITREDIIEEIVGDITDEHDVPVVMHRDLGGGKISLNARMEIYDANDIFDWELPEGEYETIGGFLLSLFHHIPSSGERIRHHDLLFTVTKSTPRAIAEVEVEKKPLPPKEDPA